MRRIHPILTDDRGVRQSVGLSVTRLNSPSLCENGGTYQDAVWGEHSWGPRDIVLHGSPDPPTDREGTYF